jgi:sulfoacetaldehyde dehydrogenase
MAPMFLYSGMQSPTDQKASMSNSVANLIARARHAQKSFAAAGQDLTDMAVAAAGWAILEPRRNRALAEQAVAETGLGNVADKIAKNHRKTLGLLRDLQGARSAGVIADDPATGVTEIARPWASSPRSRHRPIRRRCPPTMSSTPSRLVTRS